MMIPTLISLDLLLDPSNNDLQLLYVFQNDCKPCRPVGEMIEKFSKDSHALVYKVETGAATGDILSLLMQLRLQAAPTIFAFKNGQEVDRICGGITIRQFRAWVNELEKYNV